MKQQAQMQNQTKVRLMATRDVRDFMGDSYIPKGTIIESEKHPSLTGCFLIKFPYGETMWWYPEYSDAFQFLK